MGDTYRVAHKCGDCSSEGGKVNELPLALDWMHIQHRKDLISFIRCARHGEWTLVEYMYVYTYGTRERVNVLTL